MIRPLYHILIVPDFGNADIYRKHFVIYKRDFRNLCSGISIYGYTIFRTITAYSVDNSANFSQIRRNRISLAIQFEYIIGPVAKLAHSYLARGCIIQYNLRCLDRYCVLRGFCGIIYSESEGSVDCLLVPVFQQALRNGQSSKGRWCICICHRKSIVAVFCIGSVITPDKQLINRNRPVITVNAVFINFFNVVHIQISVAVH